MSKHASKTSGLRLIPTSNNSSYARPETEVDTMTEFSAITSTMSTVVLMREPEMTKNGAFSEFAKKYRPRRILDLRSFPRLDFFAGSRIRTFKLFDELHIEYLDFFGRENIAPSSNNKATSLLIMDFLDFFLADQKENDGPTVLFFDNDNLLQECKLSLPSALENTKKMLPRMNIAEYKSGFLSIYFR
ncbi:hypothetical protein D3C86_1555760 [compost metagenome]